MSYDKKTVRDIAVEGNWVLVRCDFNVPLENGTITDDRRIREALPTIQYLIENGAMVVLASHLGRPKGVTPQFTLAPVAAHLSELLEKPVPLLPDCIGPEVLAAVQKMNAGDVVLLENVRFHPEEEKNDPDFAKQLAALADIYVNDAFGTAHRAHASTEGVAHLLPAVSGFLIGKELEYLGAALDSPKRPFVAILGGAKVADKITVIENLLPKVDGLIIGGGMAFMFLKAQGHEIGSSLLDAENLDTAKRLLDQAGAKILLPVDVVVAPKMAADSPTTIVDVNAIPADQAGFDIGPKSIARFREAIVAAGTVVWNGPMGVFELDPFEAGTRGVAQALADSPGITVVGGGDSAAAIQQFGFSDLVTHVSTGGGASLEFLEGQVLPGIAALQDN